MMRIGKAIAFRGHDSSDRALNYSIGRVGTEDRRIGLNGEGSNNAFDVMMGDQED